MKINNLNINIKGIILYEKMTGNSFTRFDSTDLKSIMVLLYCALVSNPSNEYRKTFERFCSEDLTEGNIKQMSERMKYEFEFLSQFNNEPKKDDKPADSSLSVEEAKASPEEKEDVFFKDIVPILVIDCGLDINYILYEMPYTEIQDYLEARERIHREKLVEQRMWTFLTIAPHIDMKKCKSPVDLMKFPWEEKELKEKAMRDIQDKDIQDRLRAMGILKEAETDK